MVLRKENKIIMTVRELINELEGYDDDTRVVFLPINSYYYVEDISSYLSKRKISSFWSDKEFDALVIRGGQQCGSI
jgi:hypothetical protein